MDIQVRKFHSTVEEIFHEGGPPPGRVHRRAALLAVIHNPYAGRYAADIMPMMEALKELGLEMAGRLVRLLGGDAKVVEGYGKGAIVGERGEWEHAAAILHPRLGKPLRAAVEKGAALVPSAKKMGGLGTAIDVPLGHKDAAFVRSHFDAVEIRIPDAPRADEIVVAVALTDSGRPLARVGGLQTSEVKGEDGLR